MNYLRDRILELAFKKDLTDSEKKEMEHINKFLGGNLQSGARRGHLVNEKKS